MYADALKKLATTVSIAALALIALAGTAVAVVALAGGLEESYKDRGALTSAVSAPYKSDQGAAGFGYYRASEVDPYNALDELE
jgi:hypothetical protein